MSNYPNRSTLKELPKLDGGRMLRLAMVFSLCLLWGCSSVFGDSASSGSDASGSSTSFSVASTTLTQGTSESAAPDSDDVEVDEAADESREEAISELPGQLAIGDGNELYVARPDGQNLRLLEGEQISIASEPTWSKDGTELAWASLSIDDTNLAVQKFSENGLNDDDPVRLSLGPSPVGYLHGSSSPAAPLASSENSSEEGPPTNIPTTTATTSVVPPPLTRTTGSESDSRSEGGFDKLGFLQESDEGNFQLGVVPSPSLLDTNETVLSRPTILDKAAPLYFAWSPDGNSLALHSEEQTLKVFRIDPESQLVRQVVEQELEGTFRSPLWLDNETILVVDDGSATTVNIGGSEVITREIASLPANSRIVLSPDRRLLAYRDDVTVEPELSTISLNSQNDHAKASPSYFSLAPAQAPIEEKSRGELVVLEIGTGKKTRVGEGAITAWEWSPDSTKLAWLKQESFVGLRFSARWHFWTTETFASADPAQSNRVAKSQRMVVPAKVAQGLVPFFDQYAHSVTGWSPDSSAYSFAGQLAGRQAIWIQLIEVDESSELEDAADEGPFGDGGSGQSLVEVVAVSEGDFVTWGSGPTPPPQPAGDSVV